jgi:phosphohistidine phosphatase SixA
MSKEVYLLRHGRAETDSLTPQGIEDSHIASKMLIAKGLGGRAVVLSSSEPRAYQTAKIIAEDLDVLPVLKSRYMTVGGLDPRGIESLDDWLDDALKECGGPVKDNETLVVVTHEPLLKTAVYGSRECGQIEHGSVIEYEPGSWNNRDFRPFWKEFLDHKLQAY